MSDEAKPARFFVPKNATLDVFVAMAERLSGRKATPEEIEEARVTLDQMQAKWAAQQVEPPPTPEEPR